MMRKLGGGLAAILLLSCVGPAVAQPVAGLLTYEFNSIAHITTSTTTTVKAAPGLLSNFCVNTAGATANTATIFDSLTGTGTVIAVVDTTVVGCKKYDAGLKIGLTIVTATGTQADISVSYR